MRAEAASHRQNCLHLHMPHHLHRSNISFFLLLRVSRCVSDLPVTKYVVVAFFSNNVVAQQVLMAFGCHYNMCINCISLCVNVVTRCSSVSSHIWFMRHTQRLNDMTCRKASIKEQNRETAANSIHVGRHSYWVGSGCEWERARHPKCIVEWNNVVNRVKRSEKTIAFYWSHWSHSKQ